MNTEYQKLEKEYVYYTSLAIEKSIHKLTTEEKLAYKEACEAMLVYVKANTKNNDSFINIIEFRYQQLCTILKDN
jgi:hypothetical protein